MECTFIDPDTGDICGRDLGAVQHASCAVGHHKPVIVCHPFDNEPMYAKRCTWKDLETGKVCGRVPISEPHISSGKCNYDRSWCNHNKPGCHIFTSEPKPELCLECGLPEDNYEIHPKSLKPHRFKSRSV